MAEREKRLTSDGASTGAAGDYADPNRSNSAALVTQHLVEEIRQAVSEANARGKFAMPDFYKPFEVLIFEYNLFFKSCSINLKIFDSS